MDILDDEWDFTACLTSYADFLVYHRRDLETAVFFYERALKTNPKDTMTLNNYACFLTLFGDKKKDQVHTHNLWTRLFQNDENAKQVDYLWNYHLFLKKIGDEVNAETYRIKAEEAFMKHNTWHNRTIKNSHSH